MRNQNILFQAFKEYTMLFILVALMVFFWIVSPSFLSLINLRNLLIQNTYILIAAVGLSFVMMGGALDLSIGYLMSTVGVLTAMLMTVPKINPYLAMGAGLLMGMLLGGINGSLAVILKVHPIIITVATTTVFQGFSYLISLGSAYGNFPDSFRVITKGQVLGIPLDAVLAIVAILMASFVYSKTYFGRYVKAMGGNREATRLAGVNVDFVTVTTFVLCGFFVAIAAFVLISKQGVTNSTVGPGTEFRVMTAAILGGISFSTGEGKMWGLVTGVFILAVIENGMQLAGWNQYIQYIVSGAVLLAALGFDQYQRSVKVKRSRKSAVVTVPAN
jgi:ribose/xylose/arabinose/galactoside ABC-type transport system permease subunit